jgi:hypothetical protein
MAVRGCCVEHQFSRVLVQQIEEADTMLRSRAQSRRNTHACMRRLPALARAGSLACAALIASAWIAAAADERAAQPAPKRIFDLDLASIYRRPAVQDIPLIVRQPDPAYAGIEQTVPSGTALGYTAPSRIRPSALFGHILDLAPTPR